MNATRPNPPDPQASPGPPTDLTAAPMTLGALFLRFLRFGCLAWGGPTAQIDMLRAELVEQERWIDPARFNRVLAVYQALPGPEAFEMCCYFGHLKRGRLGATVAGLGFVLPGLVLMLIASWLLVRHGLEHEVVRTVLWSCGIAVAALIVNAVLRLWKNAVTSPWLVACAALAGVGSFWNVPLWISLGGCAAAGATRMVRGPAWIRRWGVWVALACGLAASAAWTGGGPGFIRPVTARVDVSLEKGARAPEVPIADLASTGLRAGLLTFGGAYTAIPVVEADLGPRLPKETVNRALAVVAVIPAPLVMFCTLVGYVGGGFVGALVMTAGVFGPTLAFTLLGYHSVERLASSPTWHAPLDAVAAGVIGMLAWHAFKTAVGAVSFGGLPLFVAAWAAAHFVRSRWSTPCIVLGAALLVVVPRLL